MSLRLDPVTTITVHLDDQRVIGQTPHGLRRVSPILGGSVAGPRLNGEVLPGGADWNLVLADGSIEFHARYTLRLGDGALVSVTNDGIEREVMAKMFAGEPLDMSVAIYGRTLPRFEVGDGPHNWLTRSIFVAELALGRPKEALLHVYEVA